MEVAGKAGAGWPALAALGIGLLIACMGDSDEGTLYGTIRPTCGPADAPALELRASTDSVLKCQDAGDSRYWTVMDYPQDSLVAGKVLLDTVQDCINGECGPKNYYKLEIRRVDSAEVRGTLEWKTQRGHREVHEAIFKRCSEVIPWCG